MKVWLLWQQHLAIFCSVLLFIAFSPLSCPAGEDLQLQRTAGEVLVGQPDHNMCQFLTGRTDALKKSLKAH